MVEKQSQSHEKSRYQYEKHEYDEPNRSRYDGCDVLLRLYDAGARGFVSGFSREKNDLNFFDILRAGYFKSSRRFLFCERRFRLNAKHNFNNNAKQVTKRL